MDRTEQVGSLNFGIGPDQNTIKNQTKPDRIVRVGIVRTGLGRSIRSRWKIMAEKN